jgi:hypothetical protein
MLTCCNVDVIKHCRSISISATMPAWNVQAIPSAYGILSYGTGGSAEGMGWLGQRLACLGYICIGVNHHGNTAIEPYRAEGLCQLSILACGKSLQPN